MLSMDLAVTVHTTGQSESSLVFGVKVFGREFGIARAGFLDLRKSLSGPDRLSRGPGASTTAPE